MPGSTFAQQLTAAIPVSAAVNTPAAPPQNAPSDTDIPIVMMVIPSMILSPFLG